MQMYSHLKPVALTILEILAFNTKTGPIDWSAVHRQTYVHIQRQQYFDDSVHWSGKEN